MNTNLELRRMGSLASHNSCLTFKFLILGPKSTGKSSFLNRACYNEFRLEKEKNVGIQHGEVKVKFKSSEFIIQLWDISGSWDYDEVPQEFFDSTIGI